MLRLAFQSLRGRKGPFAGALPRPLGRRRPRHGLRHAASGGPRRRCSGRALRRDAVRRRRRPEGDRQRRHARTEDSVALFERARLDAALVVAGRRGPGVARRHRRHHHAGRSCTARTAWSRAPAAIDIAVHPWATAALTPYALQAGHAPVTDRDARRRRRPGAARRPARGRPRPAGLQRPGPRDDRRRHRPDGRRRRAPGRPVRVRAGRGAARRHAGPRRRHRACSPTRRRPGRACATACRRSGRPCTRRHRRHARRGRAHRGHRGARGGHRDRRHVRRPRAADRDVRREQHDRARHRPAPSARSRCCAPSPPPRARYGKLVGRETLLVALAAALVGILPGAALAGLLGHALAGHGIAPEDMKVGLGLIPMLVAVAGMRAHRAGRGPDGRAARCAGSPHSGASAVSGRAADAGRHAPLRGRRRRGGRGRPADPLRREHTIRTRRPGSQPAPR